MFWRLILVVFPRLSYLSYPVSLSCTGCPTYASYPAPAVLPQRFCTKLSSLGSPLKADLSSRPGHFDLSWPSSADIVSRRCQRYPILVVLLSYYPDCLIRLSCSGCSVPAVLSRLSCPDYPVPAVLLSTLVTSCSVIAVHVLAVCTFQTDLFLTCPGWPVHTDLSGQSCPSCHVPDVLCGLPCHGFPAMVVLSLLSCSGHTILAGLSRLTFRNSRLRYLFLAGLPSRSCPQLFCPADLSSCHVLIVLSNLSVLTVLLAILPWLSRTVLPQMFKIEKLTMYERINAFSKPENVSRVLVAEKIIFRIFVKIVRYFASFCKIFSPKYENKIFDSTLPTGSYFCYVHYHLPKSVRNASFL
jgi:hypothetical protein